MHWSDYWREQAVEYRQLASMAQDPTIKEDLMESAEICEEVADKLDDRRASG